jgi:hypothetical protein
MQLGFSKDSFPCFTRLNPCVAHCSTDSIPWVLTLKGRRVPWLWRGICPLANPYELWYDNQSSTTSKVDKSPLTSLDIVPITRYTHIWRPDLPRTIFAMFSATAEHIARIHLASDPQWRPRGERLHETANSRSHFVLDYKMQTQASSLACIARPRRASHSYQEHAASPRASTTSPPNSPWLFTEARYKYWRRHLHFASIFLAPSFYKLCILHYGGRSHAHGIAGTLHCGFIAQ